MSFDTPPVEEHVAEAPAPLTTEELLAQLLAQQKEHTVAMARMQQELAESKVRPVAAPSAKALSAEELLAQRMEAVNQHDFYCPGCGALSTYQRRCNGTHEQPHPLIEMVSTDELRSGDPTTHTAAPNTGL